LAAPFLGLERYHYLNRVRRHLSWYDLDLVRILVQFITSPIHASGVNLHFLLRVSQIHGHPLVTVSLTLDQSFLSTEHQAQ
jgi:hypothetical protein